MLKNRSALLYSCVYLMVLACGISLLGHNLNTLWAIGLTYVLIPLLEWLVPLQSKPELTHLPKPSFVYDFLLYSIVPLQFLLLFLFLNRITLDQNSWFEQITLTLTMGIACGVLGINVAHELGHRTTKHEVYMANALLLTSLYMHFTIEHNKGHHKNVATEEDPATARKNESVYAFWLRCIPAGFGSAWKIEKKIAQRKKYSPWSWKNPIIRYLVIEILFCLGIALLFGAKGFVYFLLAAIIGVLHLETVNYIEHYGLLRKRVNEKRFENVQVWHSWNSERLWGRLFLFELTLHSDHHKHVHKKYQELTSPEGAPELPLGYPGAMLLSLIPPLWFKIVHPLLHKMHS